MAATFDENTPRHWHLVVFSVPRAGMFQPASMFISTGARLATLEEINAARDKGKIPKEAVIVGFDYLGFGSQVTFAGPKFDEDDPSQNQE